MNHLVFLDSHAGELEKILSEVKTMILKVFDPEKPSVHPVIPGDSLYFLRNQDGCTVRVKATVVRVLPYMNSLSKDRSQILKEMQPRLQLTEYQFAYWSEKCHLLLVEFNSAQKIAAIHIAPNKIEDRSDWIAFDDSSLIT